MIRVRELSKRFRLYRRPSDRLREMVFRRSFHRSHIALDNVSFDVPPGCATGVLGRNGAGKSTLLKLLTGVLQPDSGNFELSGRITGLLELGTGFDYQLSGKANILTNGLLLGMSADEVSERYDDIVAFSELGEFIHEPLRVYSSGMVMRLAFSIAIHADPRCLVVDEALSVGDAHFQQKCISRIREFRDQGGAMLFVSHDLNTVKMLCDEVMVLDQGRNVFNGQPEAAVNEYNRLIADEADRDVTQLSTGGVPAFGNGAAKILRCQAYGSDSRSAMVSVGETLMIELHCSIQKPVQDLTAGIVLRDRFGQDVFGTNSCQLQQALPERAGTDIQLTFAITAEVAPGQYTITAALHSGDSHLDDCYFWCDNMATFEVAGFRGAAFSGVCRLPTTLTVQAREASTGHDGIH